MSEASEVRRELVYYARKMMAEGLVAGPGGNMSARAGDVMVISPSGYSFEEAEESDYVGVDIPSGQIVEGDKRPSSEIKRVAKLEGMITLRETALEKVQLGLTTLKEVNKVTFVE